MQSNQWLEKEASKTLQRITPHLEDALKNEPESAVFMARLNYEFPRLFRLLYSLYGHQYDFFYHLQQILLHAAEMFIARPADLKALDQQREENPLWFQSEKMVGAVCYVDLFAGDLKKMHDKIAYFKELGITYLHLMPLFKSPEANNDGGYAVSDYRNTNPALGTMHDLAELSAAFRDEGISLCLDFVFNHTSDEHTWAMHAKAGDDTYQEYYYMFPDRSIPNQYERTLREIFPEQAPGNFTYKPQIDKWVWTSFYDFQWDLNYKNPEVFNAMMGEMLFLANQGVEILRLDAVAFLWKEIGTASENLPQAHMLIRAYNAITRVVAPAMLFKSEAIVHPKDVASYIGWEEAPLSYNPTLMALLWESLATRKVNLLHNSMAHRFGIPSDCAWVNYVRVHDDIGWTFADEDAAEIGINGYDHRQFLNRFYIGTFDGSFAKGVPFGFNPLNNDMRIAGTGASLAGLEQGVDRNNDTLVEMALRRLILIHSIILSVGGIPLIYLGDEIATLNDYRYLEDPNKRDDTRWVHRPFFQWSRAEHRHDPETIPGRMFTTLQKLITIRKQTPELGQAVTTFIPTGNPHVLGFIRGGKVLVLGNFSEATQYINRDNLAAFAPVASPATDLITNIATSLHDYIELAPYQVMWLKFRD